MTTQPARVVQTGDWHTGHLTGLTHPDYHYRMPTKELREYHKEKWAWFLSNVKAGPVDILGLNGEPFDGKNKKSGGRGVITTDMNEQVDMAEAIIDAIKPRTLMMTYGSGYHVGNDDDWEAVLARRVSEKSYCAGVHLRTPLLFEIEGVRFSMRHKISRSSIPHGRFTALGREALWQTLREAMGKEPGVDVLLFSHVHYYSQIDTGRRLAFCLPALQGTTDFGVRECSGDTDNGFVIFHCKDGQVSWEKKLYIPKAAEVPMYTVARPVDGGKRSSNTSKAPRASRKVTKRRVKSRKKREFRSRG